MRIGFGELHPVLDPASRWDESGHGHGSHITNLYEEPGGRRIGPVQIHWEVDLLGLRITAIEAHGLTATMLRLPLDEIRTKLASQLRENPEQTSGAVMAHKQLSQIGLTKDGGSEIAAQLNVGPEVVQEQLERIRTNLQLLTEAEIQRTGKRENPETKYRLATVYLDAYRIHTQKAVAGMQKMLDEYARDNDHPLNGIAVSSTKIRRYRKEGWLMRALPGKAGAGPGPKMFEYAREHEPDSIPRLERLRDEWQAELDKKYETDPKYRALVDARKEQEQ